jgi:ribosome-associated protein
MSSRIVDPRLESEAFAGESRSDARRAERVKEDALARLAADLCQLSNKKLEQLELSEQLSDAIGDARAISSAPAKNRQLRLIRTLLRERDWIELRGRVDRLLATGVVGPAADAVSDRSLTWTLRLVGEGQPGIDLFVSEFPRADRTHLRQLVRAVHKAEGERRLKAERQLSQALRGFLR